VVGFVIGSLEFAVGCVSWVGSVVKAAVGQGTAETLVEEQKQEGNLNTFGGEPVGIAGAMAFEQGVPLQFAEIVAELVEAIGFGGKLKVVRTAWWICLAVQPPRVGLACRRTSSKRMMRVSWILIPG
jgi:hypothetical protein